MKKSLLLVIFIIAAGCAQEQPPERVSNSDEVEARYSTAVQKAESEAKTRVALMIVEEGVQGFRILNPERRYPKDLLELVEGGMMASLPDLPAGQKFSYDAETGSVSVVAAKIDE